MSVTWVAKGLVAKGLVAKGLVAKGLVAKGLVRLHKWKDNRCVGPFSLSLSLETNTFSV